MVTYKLAKEDDYEEINNFHNRLYSTNRTLKQFYWEFNDCPYGKSIYVIAEDEGKIIGTNCVIPINLVTTDNKIIKSGKSEDTLVDPNYRGQKIFYKIYDFLFEKSKEAGIQVIWGFTSAKKPFKKLGFLVPFDHQQSLIVNNVWNSYKYLESLNSKNKIFDKAKIFGLCFLSKMKSIAISKSKLEGFKITKDEKIINGIDDIINSNLASLEYSFSFLQNSAFQEWRVYQNPNYYKVHTFGFYDNSNKLKALIVLNSHPNNVAYVIQSSFYNDLSKKLKKEMLQFVTISMFDLGIHLIRNWNFSTNILNRQEIDTYKSARYIILNRGIGFVWKELDNIAYKPQDFYLSRISTQGVI